MHDHTGSGKDWQCKQPWEVITFLRLERDKRRKLVHRAYGVSWPKLEPQYNTHVPSSFHFQSLGNASHWLNPPTRQLLKRFSFYFFFTFFEGIQPYFYNFSGFSRNFNMHTYLNWKSISLPFSKQHNYIHHSWLYGYNFI